MFSLNKQAFINATVVSLITIALVFYGSRKLQNFDRISSHTKGPAMKIDIISSVLYSDEFF